MLTQSQEIPAGFSFRLSEGGAGAAPREVMQPAAAEPLAAFDSSRLLSRLPAIKSNADDTAEFAKRVGTLPAPKTGERLPVKFPADETSVRPDTAAGRSLSVVRFSPEGEVTLAPDLSVTFSHPMVAVTSQEDAAAYAPVELSPRVEGRWRWLGTRTLMFDTDKRFPMATQFTARVPAGTRSATGQVLQKDISWTFTTPPPKVERMYPQNQIVRRNALMFIQFDQAIDQEAVLRSVSVTGGGRRLSLRLADKAEIDTDVAVSALVGRSQPGRWVAFRAVGRDSLPDDALPPASQITVNVEKGTPSAEGPLTTAASQSFQFNTFGPFRFTRSYCGYPQNTACSPFDPWYLEFSNPIETASFAQDMVAVEPKVEGLNIYPSGNYIYIQGYKKGNTTYRVTVDPRLKDGFGQSLVQPATATFKVGAAPQNFYAQGGPMVVLDPAAKPSFSIYTTGHAQARVKIHRVRPEDWNQFTQFYRRINYDDGQRPEMPGALVSNEVVTIKSVSDDLVETRIDLSAALAGKPGNLILDIEPTVRRDRYDRSRIVTWVQSTRIGLDAFVDNEELVGFATDLATGRPLGGVQLSIHPNGRVSAADPNKKEDEKGWLESALEWFVGGPSADEIGAFDADGKGVETESLEQTQSNSTGPGGLLRVPLPDSPSSAGMNLLIAKRGEDTAFLPEQSDYFWQDHGSWHRRPAADALRWFVFDDRGIYKPNEEVAVKGYIRRLTGGKTGDVEGIEAAGREINWTAFDPRNNELAKGQARLNPFGAFDLRFKLPDNVNLGNARIDVVADTEGSPASHSHQFQIQEFRRPEFEVAAKVETEAPHLVGGHAIISADAKYYAGGGLAESPVNWTVTATPTRYTPPNRDDFTFGSWVPWWRFDFDSGRPSGGTTQYYKGVTDASGRHLLKLDFDSVKPPRPYRISANAAVQDVNRQTFAGKSSLLVHPAELYVGLRTPRTFVQKGENITVEAIVTDIEGRLVAGRDFDIRAVLKDWRFDKGSWSEVTVDEQICRITSAGSPQKCTFVAKNGGRYVVTAAVSDDGGRPNESELVIWVPGGRYPPSRGVDKEEVQIIPAKKEHSPGEIAELLVMAPFTPAEGVLTLRREGIVKTERFTMTGPSINLKIPIAESYLPNIHAQVDLVGSAPRQNDKGEVDTKLANRPAFASGSMNIPVTTASRKLTVIAEAREKTLAPGSTTTVNVEVKDHAGAPVQDSEVAVVVVDESVLALTNYSIADPMSVFYTARGTGTSDHHLRKDVLLGNPEDAPAPPPPPPAANAVMETALQSRAAAPGAMAAKDGARIYIDGFAGGQGGQAAIQLRENFNALAVFAPSVRTDANGKAAVEVKLPDNLTRYRITAISVDKGKRFGKTESDITARKPLMVRPSAPRFMNFGDRIELPVVIQNQTDQDLTVDVAVRATNAALSEPGTVATGFPSADGKISVATVSRSDQSGKRLLVKANSREEVRFPVTTVKPGTARFQIAVTSGTNTDAAEISLPVWTPATTEAFATYGTTDRNGAMIQPIQAPRDVFAQFGGLEVTTSSTQLQELTDAYIYLANYPFECSEQIASRMISTAALRDVLTAFKAKGMPSIVELEARFARDVQILKSRQRDDGSFGLWRRERERYEYPFLTVHVAHALALAKAKGYQVPDEMIARTKPFLSNVENHMNDRWHAASPQVRWTVSAYALYVRDLTGDKDAGKAKKILAEARTTSPAGQQRGLYETKMSFEALGWILSVLADEPGSASDVAAIVRYLLNRTTETAAAANFVTDYADGGWLIMHSNRRADGVLLEALIKADKQSGRPNARPGSTSSAGTDGAASATADLIPKLVRGLLAHRKKGHWGSTQENVFILLALDKYFEAFEKVTPNFVTRVWLGEAYAGEQTFAGRSVDSNVLEIPMSYLASQGGSADLLLDRQGAGRLYYRIGMKYAPNSLKLDPADYGFTVLRSYEAVDDKEDVRRNSDGTWAIRSGARVRIRLTMVAQARRYHIALVDNLPAGLEILNPGLATTEALPPDTGGGNTGVLEAGSRSLGFDHYWWRRNWFEHQNFRDERAEAFASLLWEGVYNYTYVARATTPGRFIVPPAKAEEMYTPETFGRTGTDILTVE
jgi:alpha-2-macroglobulin